MTDKYTSKTRKGEYCQKIIYLLVGGSSFIIEYCIFAALHSYNIFFAQSVSFLLGAFVSFMGNKYIVFGRSGSKYGHNTLKQGAMYVLLIIINLFVSNILIGLFTIVLMINPFIAKFVTVGCMVLWNFVIYKMIIFKIEDNDKIDVKIQ